LEFFRRLSLCVSVKKENRDSQYDKSVGNNLKTSNTKHEN
jgi:hypothetical protein